MFSSGPDLFRSLLKWKSSFRQGHCSRKEMDNVMVVDFGRTRTTFAIVSGGKVQFATTIAFAGEEIEKAFILNLKIDRSQVEAAKRDIGLIKRKGNESLFESLRPLVSVIKDEAAKQAAYWVSQNEDNKKMVKYPKLFYAAVNRHWPVCRSSFLMN